MVLLTFPAMSVQSNTGLVFPEFNTADAAALVNSGAFEGTLELEQNAADWNGVTCGVTIQADDNDVDADGFDDDIQYKLVGSWPQYRDTNGKGTSFDTAKFVVGDGVQTLGASTLDPATNTVTAAGDPITVGAGTGINAETNPLRRLLRADISEDMFGATDAFDKFGNQTSLDDGFGAVASALETLVETTWSGLVTADAASPTTNATSAAAHPGRHIFERIFETSGDASPHAGLTDLITNLQARSANTEFVALPLKANDTIEFSLEIQAPGGSPEGNDMLTTGVDAGNSGAPGLRSHLVKVKITLI